MEDPLPKEGQRFHEWGMSTGDEGGLKSRQVLYSMFYSKFFSQPFEIHSFVLNKVHTPLTSDSTPP